MWANGEGRWLEKAMWIEVWGKHSGFLDYEWRWEPIKWLDHKRGNLLVLKVEGKLEAYYQGDYATWKIIQHELVNGAEIVYGKLKSEE
ncbi:MAG: hypothetical protein RSC49_04655 [Clostridium sp.]